MALAFGKLELFDVVHNLFCPYEFGELEDLVDWIIADQEWSLLKDLNSNDATMPASIMPTDQQSTR